MKRGRPPKNNTMQQNDANKLPPSNEGDVIKVALEITRVSNGFILKNINPQTPEGTMVFNGADGHRTVAAHVLMLALADMKEGEILNYESGITYVKKI